MRRLAVPLALLAALAVTGGGIALVLASRGGDGDDPRPLRQSLTIVSSSVRPSVHAFGEPVVAELVLVGDAEVVRPETVRIDPDFAPYEAAGPGHVERIAAGSSVRWRFRYPLRCLREGCAPAGDRRTFEFPLASVAYRFQLSPGPASIIVEWPRFQVTARVDDAALAQRAWRGDVSAVPAPSYRWAPGTLAAALLVGTAGFAGLGVGLAGRLSRRRAPAVEAGLELVPTLAPLERALELAREASRNGDSPDRRRALERVARELGGRGLAELADRARALAWASGAADPDAIEDLARDARTANGGSG
ncbi:MAG: hypothetical protein MSC30_02520 [Gaiellaceae bacterium MAG52_C11]|nr:hypothetical protein [Candidatus Gaiellasilicea maunaloa]